MRIQSTRIWGPVVSSTADSAVLNLQTINDWPASIFNFGGTGATAAQNSAAAYYVVNTTGLTVPAGTDLWIDGVVSPFGAAPPDFLASTVNNEAGVQVVDKPVVYVPATAGGPILPATAGTLTCGNGNFSCIPASLEVIWSRGTTAPFANLTLSSMSINLSNADLASAIIHIGAESIPLASLPSNPTIVPVPEPATGAPGAAGAAGLQTVFMPLFSVGNPLTSSATTTTTPAATSTATTALQSFNSFADFAFQVNHDMNATNPAEHLQATGFYNRATNTFSATTVNLLL